MPSAKRKRASEAASDRIKEEEEEEEVTSSSQLLVDDTPFTIRWVGAPKDDQPAKKKLKNKIADESVVREEEGISGTGLHGHYVVLPGKKWESLRKYRNFVVNQDSDPKDNDQSHKFELGQYVFVNHSDKPAKTVDDDRELWVAQVREVRAEGPHAVYIRVIWMYWPDELPMGREVYHGQNELVASNDMQIIDAMTISGKANVVHLQDVHEKNEVVPGDALYWRQTYDVTKPKKTPSALPKDCVCKTVTNPDSVIVQCPHVSCLKWQHEQCLIDSTLTKYWKEHGDTLSRITNTASAEGNRVVNGKSEEQEEIGDSIEAKPRPMGFFGAAREGLGQLLGKTNVRKEALSTPSSAKKGSKKAKNRTSKASTIINQDRPWEGKLVAQLEMGKNEDISSENGQSDSGSEGQFTGKVVVYRLSADGQEKVRDAIAGVEVHCLLCNQSMADSETPHFVEEAPSTTMTPVAAKALMRSIASKAIEDTTLKTSPGQVGVPIIDGDEEVMSESLMTRPRT